MTLRRGRADAHDSPYERHWTVRGFQNGRSGYALHVFPGTREAEGFDTEGKRWRRKSLDTERMCYRLDDDAAEDGGRVLDYANESGGGPQCQRTAEGESSQVGLSMEAEKGHAEQNAGEEGKGQTELNATK